MGSASFPSLHLPTFSCESAHPGEVTQQRLVARLYASVKISVNESRNGSRGTASGLPTIRTVRVLMWYDGAWGSLRSQKAVLLLLSRSELVPSGPSRTMINILAQTTAIMVGKGSFGGKKRSSLGWQIKPLPQESIGDDKLMVSVARMRSGTVDHSSKKPAAV